MQQVRVTFFKDVTSHEQECVSSTEGMFIHHEMIHDLAISHYY